MSAAASRAKSAKPPRGLPLLLLGAILAAVAPGMALLVILLLLPVLGHLPRDPVPGKPASRAMALFAIAAALPDAARVYAADGGLAAGLAVALDPAVVARAWAAQGIAWLLGELLPALLIAASDTGAARQIRALQAERVRLAEDWEEPG